MSRPNFVLVMTDTQATNVIGAYGHPELETRNIDRLAQKGVQFQRAYTTCPVCTPARAGIFTGMYPSATGAWTNNLPLGDNIKTMGQRFQDAGYHTANIGKWHLDGHDYFGTGICPPGWDKQYWFDGKKYLAELSEAEIAMWRSGLNNIDNLRQASIQPEFTWAHRVSDRAIRFLQNTQPDQPFLLVVSYDEPHHPYTCPPDYVEKFLDYDYPLGPGGRDTLELKPGHQREWAAADGVKTGSATARHPLYFGCNAFVDVEIGRVIAAVETCAPENTFLIFTSDHGDMLGAHGLRGKGPAMYEEIIHIPLLICLPGCASAGAKVSTPVSHIDLLSTMLELAGLERPPILDGNSLVPLLHGQEQTGRVAVSEFLRYEIEHDSWGGFQPIRCIIDERYKLVINLLHTDELYDLWEDPGEVENRIDDPSTASVRDVLHDRLLDWMNEHRDPFRGPVWERRLWRFSHRNRWTGQFRPRPVDGYAPEVRDYDTGMPSRGVKVEFSDKKPL